MMYYLYVRLKPVHGFAARLQPQSKMRSSFKYPPPTTFIGALSYPLMRQISGRIELSRSGKSFISMANKIKKKLLTVAGHLHGYPVVYGSFLRINRMYRGTVDSGVTAFPTTILYTSKDSFIEVIYILKEMDHEYVRAGWGITRLGSRESVFHTDLVEWGKAEEVEDVSLDTRFSFWLEEALDIKGSGNIIYCVDWRDTVIGDYSRALRKPYFYPVEHVKVVSKNGSIKGYLIDYSYGEEVVLA